jgi:cobalt-zinc-cadmium efflux system protein
MSDDHAHAHDDHDDHDGHDHDGHDHGGHDHGGHDHDGHDHDDKKRRSHGHGGHGHDHGGHGHAHHHLPPTNPGRAFAVGVALNIAFVIAGVIAGVAAGSTALLADAAHNLGDVLGLALAWGATVLAARARTSRRTYGFRRTTILAAFANAMVILVAIGGVAWEAILRLGSPQPVAGGIVAVVAAGGVAVNGIAAMMFASGRDRDLNMRGAYLHLVADAGVSAGVVVSGIVVWQTGLTWIDPLTSLLVSVTILFGTVRLLREALDLMLDAVPPRVDPEAVAKYLAALPDVREVHDLHIWSMSTTEVAMTAHLVAPWGSWPPSRSRDVASHLDQAFGIGHVTLQLEDATEDVCQHAMEGNI